MNKSEIAEKATDEILSFVERCDSGYVLVACKKCQFAVKALVERAIAESQASHEHSWSSATGKCECGAKNESCELGDGEPGPLGTCDIFKHTPHEVTEECRNWESGAAQEVSPPATGTSSDPRTGYLKQEEVSPPSPVEILKLHWLMEITCDHAAKTDQPLCACGWRGPVCSNVGDAVTSWANHAAELIRGDTRELKAAAINFIAEVRRFKNGWQSFDVLEEKIAPFERLLG